MIYNDLTRYLFHRKRWKPARARVISSVRTFHIPTRGDWSLWRYRVTLRYQVEGHNVESTFRTDDARAPGARVPIYYDPQNPIRNTEAPLGLFTRISLWVFGLVGIFLLLNYLDSHHLAPWLFRHHGSR